MVKVCRISLELVKTNLKFIVPVGERTGRRGDPGERCKEGTAARRGEPGEEGSAARREERGEEGRARRGACSTFKVSLAPSCFYGSWRIRYLRIDSSHILEPHHCSEDEFQLQCLCIASSGPRNKAGENL